MANVVRMAAAQYPIHELTSFAAFETKLEHWVSEAAQNGAQVLVFPEYSAMELARIAGTTISRDLHASINSIQYLLPEYGSAYNELAKQHKVFILTGTAPVVLTDDRIVNRARIFGPNGTLGYQQKHVMTRFEREDWGISASEGLCAFDLGFACIGIAICYDAEFPLIARALAKGGADILLVPSCTDTLSGFHRVRMACQARALENQIYVVQSCTVGDAAWSAALDVNVGRAGFFAPPDRLFPADGVLAQGEMNKPMWVYADLDLDLLREVRKNGEVLNARDWDLQPGASELPPATLVPLA